MTRRLPAFAALRAFEAAAQEFSFRRAAEKLSLTESAVSHQIKRLEADLGVQLFRRLNRGLELTREGQTYLKPVRDALDQLAEATVQVRQRRDEGPLTVSLMGSFAVHWLIPRLRAFQDAHPTIEVRLVTSCELVNFAEEDVDAAIRYGCGEWPGLRADRIIAERFFPVCSPSLATDGPPLAQPADLAKHSLLQNAGEPDAWRMWLHTAGLDDVNPYAGPTFDTLALITRAAMEGMGVAIGYRPLVDEDLESGRLLAPFDMTLTSGYAYYFVCPTVKAEQPKIVAFRNWLVTEIANAQERSEGQRWLGAAQKA